jgi:hypothetical protein
MDSLTTVVLLQQTGALRLTHLRKWTRRDQRSLGVSYGLPSPHSHLELRLVMSIFGRFQKKKITHTMKIIVGTARKRNDRRVNFLQIPLNCVPKPAGTTIPY